MLLVSSKEEINNYIMHLLNCMSIVLFYFNHLTAYRGIIYIVYILVVVVYPLP